MSAPGSAAISILGVAASDVKQNVNLQDLTSGLINSFDKNGHLKQGFGFSTSFKNLGFNTPDRDENFHNYFNSVSKRLSWGSNLSIAAIRGSTNDDPSGRIAAALSFPLIDNTDWRANDATVRAYSDEVVRNLTSVPTLDRLKLPANIVPKDPSLREKALRRSFEFSNLLTRTWSQATPEDIAKSKAGQDAIEYAIKALKAFLDADPALPGTIELYKLAVVADNKVLNSSEDGGIWDDIRSMQVKTVLTKATDKFFKDVEGKFWNHTKLDVSVATSWFAADATKDNFSSDGFYAWAAYSNPLNKNAKYTLYGRYATKDRSFDTDAKTWDIGNSTAFGAALHLRDGGFLEYMSSSLKNGAGTKKDVIWQGGFELKVNEDQWLQISLGKGSSGGQTRNILGINWSFNLSPTKQLGKK